MNSSQQRHFFLGLSISISAYSFPCKKLTSLKTSPQESETLQKLFISSKILSPTHWFQLRISYNVPSIYSEREEEQIMRLLFRILRKAEKTFHFSSITPLRSHDSFFFPSFSLLHIEFSSSVQSSLCTCLFIPCFHVKERVWFPVNDKEWKRENCVLPSIAHIKTPYLRMNRKRRRGEGSRLSPVIRSPLLHSIISLENDWDMDLWSLYVQLGRLKLDLSLRTSFFLVYLIFLLSRESSTA